MKHKTIIALPADLHCGSAFGLMPPSWVTVEGQVVEQSETQRLLWSHWIETWKKIGESRDGGRLVIIHMGDGTEGIHHGIVDIASARVDEHARMNVESMRKGMEIAEFDRLTDKLYYIVGSIAHVRNGAQSEEEAARKLESDPFREAGEGGRYTWPKLEIKMYGKLLWFMHQGAGINQRWWMKGNLVHDAMKHVYFSRLDMGLEIPDLVVMAHRHVPTDRTYPGERKDVRGLILPSMKGIDEYANRITMDSMAMVGVHYLEVSTDGISVVKNPITIWQSEAVEL